VGPWAAAGAASAKKANSAEIFPLQESIASTTYDVGGSSGTTSSRYLTFT
jgi:hypothetical protein